MKPLRIVAAMALALTLIAVDASTSFAQKGGNGGGGGNKPAGQVSIKYVGYITNLQPTANGVLLTVGTSYYSTGTVLVTNDTKIRLNGSQTTAGNLRLGDYAEIKLLWPSRLATNIEVVGAR